jgi:hypothetical protein
MAEPHLPEVMPERPAHMTRTLESVCMSDPLDAISDGAAWMELRAQQVSGSPEDRDRADDVAAWLQYWLSRAAQDLDPTIVAFVAACAEREQSALASASDAAEVDA